MLVLTRKKNETLDFWYQGQKLATVNVSDIAGNRVSIGVEAPKDVRVVRGELPSPQWPIGEPVTPPAAPEVKHVA
jgi:carbon storage regulator